MIITVTPNPAVDKSVVLDNLKIDAVNRVKEIRIDAGGKGINVSKVVASLDGKSIAMGIVGGSAGNIIESQIKDMGIKCDFIKVDSETRTNLKIYDKQNKTYTDINESGCAVGIENFNLLYSKVESTAKKDDVVVLAGSATADIPQNEFAEWTQKLTAKGVKVIVDMDGDRLKNVIDKKPYAIKPNEFELQEIYGLKDVEIPTLTKKAKEIVDSGVGLVVVSMGGRGALFVNKDESLHAYAPPLDIVSTVGAGDSITAVISLSIDNGDDLKTLALKSVATGSAKVMSPGSSPPSKEQIEKYKKLITINQI